MSFDGTNVPWTRCDTNASCWVTVTYVGTNGARSVMGDASQIFYVDNAALKRLTY